MTSWLEVMIDEMSQRRQARFWVAVRVVLGLIGIAFAGWLIQDVGGDELAVVLVPALPWIPLAAALELARIGMDALSSRYSLGRRGHEVPWAPLVGAHLVAYAVMGVAPLGRATAEAVKASLLYRWIGAATAAALGTANQANTFLSSGTFSVFCALAAYAITGPSYLTWALVGHSAFLCFLGFVIRLAARYERVGLFLARRFPSVGQQAKVFQVASRETALYPLRPVGAMMLGRAFQAAHFAVLAAAVGIDPTVLGALAFQGVSLVIAALGVMIPGQLGASEGGFTFAADTLGTTEARALSVALLAHAVQLLLIVVGSLVLSLWRPPADPSLSADRAAR